MTVTPLDRPGRQDEELTDVARRAADLADELAVLLGRLADDAGRDARVRQARHRLADAADSCRRAGEELRERAAARAVPPVRTP